MNRWWDSNLGEQYWLEITDRPDLGIDLRAPQSNGSGQDYWSYALIRELLPGDVVFHYWKPKSAIVAWSRAVGESWPEEIVWASHGTVAREAGIEPFLRPGWRLGLTDFTVLDEPVSLEEIRGAEPWLRTVAQTLVGAFGEPTYFPVALSDMRAPRPAQGYLTKWPADLLLAFPALVTAAADAASTAPASGAEDSSPLLPSSNDTVGAEYRTADVDAATSRRDPFSVDPAIVERGLRGHALAQEALAAFIRELGCQPRSPRADEPNYDLAWTHEGVAVVAEVKSLTDANEEKQLRLGLGQVLRYRYLMNRSDRPVRAVLMAEREPTDSSWVAVCSDVGVSLLWPAALENPSALSS